MLSQRGLRTYPLPQSAAARVGVSGRRRDQSHLLHPHPHNHPGGHAPGAWGGDNKEPGAFDWSSAAGYVGFPRGVRTNTSNGMQGLSKGRSESDGHSQQLVQEANDVIYLATRAIFSNAYEAYIQNHDTFHIVCNDV